MQLVGLSAFGSRAALGRNVPRESEGKPAAAGGDKVSDVRPLLQNSAKAVEPINTRSELAKVAGVSHDTIAKVAGLRGKRAPLCQ